MKNKKKVHFMDSARHVSELVVQNCNELEKSVFLYHFQIESAEFYLIYFESTARQFWFPCTEIGFRNSA